MTRETREKKDEELRLGKRVEGGRGSLDTQSSLKTPAVRQSAAAATARLYVGARASPMTSLRRKEKGEKGDRKRMGFIIIFLLQWSPRRSGFKYDLGQLLYYCAMGSACPQQDASNDRSCPTNLSLFSTSRMRSMGREDKIRQRASDARE